MEVKTRARKWGSSLAVIIPKEIAKERKIEENSEIVITIERAKPRAGVLFGKFPRLKRWSTQELKDEARRGWESDSDREREKRWK